MSTSVPAAPTAPEAGAAPTAPAAPAAAPPQDSDQYVAQKDVDRIVGERLGRERAKFEREYETKIEEAKTAARAETAKGYDTKMVNTSAKAIARDLGFHDTADALGVVDPDKLPLKDGEVDDEALKKLLEDLAKAKPYLVKEPDKNPPVKRVGKPSLPAGNADPNGEPKKGTAAEALRQLRASKGI